MADGVLSLVVSLESVTGLPENKVVNVLNVGVDGVLGGTTVDDCIDEVVEFWTTLAVGQGTVMGSWLSDSISRVASAATVTAYSTLDLTGATPMGSPIDTRSFTVPAAVAGTPLPEEVATVISYHGDLDGVPVTQANPAPPPAVIRPAQRRRGRMYVGPLQIQTGAEAGNILRPASNYRTDSVLAFSRMAESINTHASVYFGVWSKSDAEVWQAVSCYMDDAWDTQRRRGVDPTTRTVEPIA